MMQTEIVVSVIPASLFLVSFSRFLIHIHTYTVQWTEEGNKLEEEKGNERKE